MLEIVAHPLPTVMEIKEIVFKIFRHRIKFFFIFNKFQLYFCFPTFFFFFFCFLTEFMQPQHIWPYLQQNFIHHPHFPHPAFLTHQTANGNSCQPQTASSSSPGSTISDSDNHSTCTTNSISTNTSSSNNNNNIVNSNNSNNSGNGAETITASLNGNDEDNNRRLLLSTGQDKPTAPLHHHHHHHSQHHYPMPHVQQTPVATAHSQAGIIAKPLPSRPTPFLPHSLQHPHLHSLLAHCRNPYMSGKCRFYPILSISSCLSIVVSLSSPSTTNNS